MATRTHSLPLPITRPLAPGVRLHVVRTRQFATTVCRIVAHRRLGADAAAAAVLARVMASATARHGTRRELADALADLYGATLNVGVGKLGDRQLLSATLEWPTAHVVASRSALISGLELLREVWTEPAREPGPGVGLRGDLVESERTNLIRAHASLRSDKAAYALRALIATTCRGEPFARDARGTAAEAEAVSGAGVARLHRSLIRRAPVDIWLVGDLAPGIAERTVRKHLGWSDRAARPAARPRVVGMRSARPRPRRRVLTDEVAQTRLALAWRGALPPRDPRAAAAVTLAGVLGGGAYGRLFKVLREREGLCYDGSAYFDRAKGLLVVQMGVDPGDERRARQRIGVLQREVAAGRLDPEAHAAFLEDQAHRVETLPDERSALIGWFQQAQALGLALDPRVQLSRLASVTEADVRRAGKALGLDATVVLRPPEGSA